MHPKIPWGNDLIGNIVKGYNGTFDTIMEELNIRGHPHGVVQGWFLWPFNFDPVWLESCNGFTPKEDKATVD
jgi:hypothetical protein